MHLRNLRIFPNSVLLEGRALLKQQGKPGAHPEGADYMMLLGVRRLMSNAALCSRKIVQNS